MRDRSFIFTLCGTALIFALPFGVNLTVLGLAGGTAERIWLGLPLLATGIFGLECLRRVGDLMLPDSRIPSDPHELRSRDAEVNQWFSRDVLILQCCAVALLQVISILKFVFLLDGHITLRACCWLHLVYGTGAVLVLLGRQASTPWGSRYLQWAWAPILAFGVPLLLPTLKEIGLIPSSPLDG